MRVPTDVFQSVDDLGFQFDQRFNCYLIDFFEGFAVDVLKVLCFELLNKFRVSSLHVGLSDGTVFVKSKMFFA